MHACIHVQVKFDKFITQLAITTLCIHVRFIGIVFNEIYIRENLVYDKYSSKVIGFVNLGDVDQLTAFCP